MSVAHLDDGGGDPATQSRFEAYRLGDRKHEIARTRAEFVGNLATGRREMSDKLTRREAQCVELAGKGFSDKEIRRCLGMGSERTVQGHLARAYTKLGVHDRRAAAEILGNNYAELPVLIPEPPQKLPSRIAEAVEIDHGGDLKQGRSIYDRYVQLGRWRKPPRWWGGRSLLVLGVAGLVVVALGGTMALLKVVFEVVELLR